MLAIMTVVAVALAGYAYYGHRQMRQQQALAEELFYTMKSLDVDIANVERLVEMSGNPKNQDQVRGYLERRRELENSYDKFLSGLKLYGGDLTEEERLILRVHPNVWRVRAGRTARVPAEVGRYIKRWQATQRYLRAVKLAQEKGYIRKIAEEFFAHNLPPQFFYLAMQESDFDPFSSRPSDAVTDTQRACGSSFPKPASDMASRSVRSSNSSDPTRPTTAPTGRKPLSPPRDTSRKSTPRTRRHPACSSWRHTTGAKIA